MHLLTFLILCVTAFVLATPISRRSLESHSKEHKSLSEEDSVLLRAMEFISFLIDDQETEQILTATESKKYITPDEILSLPLQIPPSESEPSTKRRKRSKQQSFDLFEIIPYIPEEIPWSNQAYKNPGVYGGGWGTHHFHPVVLLKN